MKNLIASVLALTFILSSTTYAEQPSYKNEKEYFTGRVVAEPVDKNGEPVILSEPVMTNALADYPSYYSLADEGLVTSVKDQGYTNNCWSYAGVGAIESSLLMQDIVSSPSAIDLSESQIAWSAYRGNDKDTNKGDGPTYDMPYNYGADWQEFATKARWLYSAIGDTMDVSVSYPWITYWFTGMSPKEVYTLAYTAFTDYAKKSEKADFWKKCKWTSPASYPGSVAGSLSVSYNQGITVSPELLELFAALEANGIDAWICSASYVDVINAAVKAFNIPGVDGVVAMTNKKVNGVYTNEYDYDFHAQTQGPGKAESIDKVVRPLYRNQGPVLVAFDSQGDFNFCTVYKDTVTGLGLNRARKDDAGILAAIAVYQNQKKLTLADTMKSGDIRYVLQGRNENGGKLWARPEVQALGKKSPELLSAKAEGWLKMLNEGTTPAQLVNKAPELTGKLKTFEGYKTR